MTSGFRDRRVHLAGKRAVDAVAALLGLVLLSPLLLAVAAWVRLDSPGPALFRGERVGRDARLFWIVKFRSMRVGAVRTGPGVTVFGDPRVTRAGRFLRMTKLDELPQLWNVLVGEMSLVGPRPESPEYVALYMADQRQILEHRPGITSPASIVFRNEEAELRGEGWERRYVEELMPRKISMDLDYMERATVFSDLCLIVGTVLAVLGWKCRPAGALAPIRRK